MISSPTGQPNPQLPAPFILSEAVGVGAESEAHLPNEIHTRRSDKVQDEQRWLELRRKQNAAIDLIVMRPSLKRGERAVQHAFEKAAMILADDPRVKTGVIMQFPLIMRELSKIVQESSVDYGVDVDIDAQFIRPWASFLRDTFSLDGVKDSEVFMRILRKEISGDKDDFTTGFILLFWKECLPGRSYDAVASQIASLDSELACQCVIEGEDSSSEVKEVMGKVLLAGIKRSDKALEDVLGTLVHLLHHLPLGELRECCVGEVLERCKELPKFSPHSPRLFEQQEAWRAICESVEDRDIPQEWMDAVDCILRKPQGLTNSDYGNLYNVEFAGDPSQPSCLERIGKAFYRGPDRQAEFNELSAHWILEALGTGADQMEQPLDAYLSSDIKKLFIPAYGQLLALGLEDDKVKLEATEIMLRVRALSGLKGFETDTRVPSELAIRPLLRAMPEGSISLEIHRLWGSELGVDL